MLSLFSWLFLALAGTLFSAIGLRLGGALNNRWFRWAAYVLIPGIALAVQFAATFGAVAGLKAGLISTADGLCVLAALLMFFAGVVALFMGGVGRRLPIDTTPRPWRRRERWWLPIAFLLACTGHMFFLHQRALLGDTELADLRAQTLADVDSHLPAIVAAPAPAAPGSDAISGYREMVQRMDDANWPTGESPLTFASRFNVAVCTERRPADSTSLSVNPNDSRSPNAPRITVAAFLAAHMELRQECLALIRRPVYRYGPPPIAGHDKPTDQAIFAPQQIAVFLSLDAWEAAQRGDELRAVEDYEAMLTLSDQLTAGREQLIAFLVATAVRGIAQSSAEELLARPDLTPALLRAWKLDPARTCQQAFVDAMVAENDYSVAQVQRFQNMSLSQLRSVRLEDEPAGSYGYVNWLLRAYVLPNMAASLVPANRQLQQLARQPAAATMALPAGTGPLDQKPTGIFPRILIPAFVSTFRQAVKTDVQLDLARLARAATLYKLDTGQWPATLDALVPTYIPAVPIDPFDAKPLKMRSADGGLILWSIGDDQVDDNGVRGQTHFGKPLPTGAWDELDITFYVGPARAADTTRFRQAWAAEHPDETVRSSAADALTPDPENLAPADSATTGTAP